MSIALMTLARKTALQTNQKFALMALADWADDNGSNCWPSVYELSEYMTCSERTVQRMLRELEEQGWIAVVAYSNGGVKSRHYCLNVQRMNAEAQIESARRDAAKERRRREWRADEANPFIQGFLTDGGDRLSPVTTATEGVTSEAQGVTTETSGVTTGASRGDTAVTPTTIYPPIEPPSNKRKRVNAPSRPDGVSEQTWSDWFDLRRSKKAPITQTVLDGAVREAGKAGLSLEDFLKVWCERGSQGLMADWLRPHERGARPSSGGRYAAAAATIYEGVNL